MIRTVIFPVLLALASPAWAEGPHDHEAGDAQSAHHGDHDHGGHETHDADKDGAARAAPGIVRTPAIEAALANGGAPVVVDVLGAVCDFCAKAMNKTFGKREEVAAAYVDLDDKTLSLVLKPGATLSDEAIFDLVKKSGYNASAIRRADAALTGDADAADPA